MIVLYILLLLCALYILALQGRRNHPLWSCFRAQRFAHRGYHDKPQIPENSLPAFRRAIAHGWGAELDVHLLKDGTLAVFHDSSLSRCTGAQGMIEDLTLPELKALRLEGTQEQYVSTIHDTTEVGVIPVTMPLSNMDFVTACLEVLGRETAKTVLPAYYDNGLKVKYVDGSDEAAMIDLIHDTVASPFILGYGLNGLMSDMFLVATSNKQSDFASQFAKNEAKYQTALDDLITQLTESVERANS